MVEPIQTPPHPPTTVPGALSPTVSLNPPMVGSASPFERVDGQNRDLILEAIRAWARGPLFDWAGQWQTGLIEWLNNTENWLDSWNDEVVRYVQDVLNAVINNSIELQDPVLAAILSDPTTLSATLLNDRFDTLTDDVAELTAYLAKRRDRVSVYNFGAVGDGVADDTAAIKAAVAYAAAGVQNAFGSMNVVELGGKFKITSTIVVPPYVKLRAKGQVIVEWHGDAGGPAIWLTPLAGDKYNLPGYQDPPGGQEANANIIDGNDGGFFIVNTRELTPGAPAVGIEVGSRGQINRPQARYGIASVCVSFFDVNMLLNTYNHYITRYENVQIARGGKGVVVAAGGVNSGEKIDFNNCLITQVVTGFEINAPFDVNFMSTSLDYFYERAFHVTSGYVKLYFAGGHIEALNYPTVTLTGSLVNSTAASGEVYVEFSATRLLAKRQKWFAGTNLYVSGTCYMNQYDTDTETLFTRNVVAESGVRAVMLRNNKRTNRPLITWDTNRISDPYWDKETVGAKTSLIDWAVEVSGAGVTYSVIDETPFASGKSVQVVIPAGGYFTVDSKYTIPKVDLDEFYLDFAINTSLAGIQLSGVLDPRTYNDTSLGRPGAIVVWQSNSMASGDWRVPRWLTAGLPANSMELLQKASGFRPRFTVSNPTAVAATVKIGGLYFGK